MPDIVSLRQTVILVADDDGLYPSEYIYPANDLFPKDAGFLEITNIVAGSLKLSELISERIPQFGQLYSTKFECKVYLVDDLRGKFIQVYQLDGNVYRSVFMGQIDSCKLDKLGTDRTIVAYDFGYTKGQVNVAPWWTEFWSNRETATLRQARNSMLKWIGLSYEDVELPNDSLQITKTVDITSCTFTSMLRMMCEINYCFPHFDRMGMLTYVFLNTDPEQVVDLTGLYEGTNSEFETFETVPIDGVQFYDSGNQLKWTTGQTDNAYPIKKNIFLYEKSTEILDSIGQDILDYLQDLIYVPAKVKMIVGDFELGLGDYVHTEQGNFYILQNKYSGSQLIEQTIEAQGQEVLYGGTPHIDYGELVLNEKIARVNFTIEQFQIEYGDFKDQTNASLTINANAIATEVSRASQAEGNLSSRITQTADSITAEVTRATGAESSLSSRITQNAESISSEVTRATGAESNLSSRITQTAESISSEVTRATGAESSLSSRITQNADAITSEVTRATSAEGTLSSRITQNADSISSEVTRATNAEGYLDSRITQTAESISLDVTNGETSSTIVLKLGETQLSSKTIQMTGLVTFSALSGSGQTTINGDNITTGTIDASRVSVTNLNADNITSGTISADKIQGGQLTISAEHGYTNAIVVKVGNYDYITMNESDGLIVGKSYGSYKTTITGSGINVGDGRVTINGDVGSGAIVVGSSTSSQISMKNGQLTINNNSFGDGAVKISSNNKGIVISGGSSSNAIEVSQGNTSVKGLSCTDLSCTSLSVNRDSYSSGTITMITGSSSSFTPSFSEIKDVDLADNSLWAVDSYSAPNMKGNSTNGYSFSSSPTWKKISLSKSSYSTKVYGMTGGSSISSPTFATKTVLVKN